MNNRTQIIMQEIDHQNNQKIEYVISKEKSRLLNFIRQRTPTLEDAEDILQDVFYELVQSYRLMKPVEQLASWLFTVARNKITDSYRKKKSSSLEDVAHMQEENDEPLFLADILKSNALSADEKMMNDLIMETIADCLDELPKEQRDAFVMHELEDKSMQQIADEMNVSVKTVISRKRYAVLFLRERLQFIYKQILNN
ncbi:MAG: sigma-70 family RNA polymerase sigma factor [Chitinophagales bacterium]|nr:sigma-70 family RNA polymerase sigma factor [Chitinophagales bacterium]